MTQPDQHADHRHAHPPGQSHHHAREHAHAHRHSHDHRHTNYDRAFAIGIGLNLTYIAAEAAAGLLAGSLALLADAGHNLSDVLGLALAWGAAVLARRRPTHRFTYGLRSSSILAALANAIILLVVTGGLAWEAIFRFTNPAPVEGAVMAWVAGIGILVNGATALLFLRGSERDLNIRGAFLHMMADALVSAGVVVSGVAIMLTGLWRIDPIVTLLVCAVIVYGTWGLMKEAIGLALDAVPEGIDPAAVRAHLASLPGVAAIHDLHIWGMSTTETALTCHLVMPQGHPGDAVLTRIARDLEQCFGIHHATIQIELGDSAEMCLLTPETVV
ncbi:MAG: cation diffusion facilitator family transporter [Alphaproteobacteria bacterium]